MRVRLLWVCLDRSTKHLRGAGVVLHLIESFAGEHVGFGGVGIQSQNLVIDVEHVLRLFRPQIAVRERKQQRQVVGLGVGSLF